MTAVYVIVGLLALVLVVGIIFNFVGAILFQLSLLENASPDTMKRLTITALFFTIPLYTSWIVLTEAFRRFKNSEWSEQVINNTKVFAMVFTYLFYALGITLVVIIVLIHSILKFNNKGAPLSTE